MEMLIMTAFTGVLAVVAWIDGRTMEIPDELSVAVLLLSGAASFTDSSVSVFSRIAGLFSVSLPMLLLTLAVPGAFGGGDIKLTAACGVFLGWRRNLLGFFFAVLGGGSWAAWLLLRKKAGRKDHFAFGPFLCAGMVTALFWGDKILDWYLSLLM